jgi:hypothetical protein
MKIPQSLADQGLAGSFVCFARHAPLFPLRPFPGLIFPRCSDKLPVTPGPQDFLRVRNENEEKSDLYFRRERRLPAPAPGPDAGPALLLTHG